MRCSRFRLFRGTQILTYAIALAAIVSLALPAGAQWPPPPPPELKFAEIGIGARANYLGDRWSYMEAGHENGPTVVMLHGVGGNSMDWRFQLADLSVSSMSWRGTPLVICCRTG